MVWKGVDCRSNQTIAIKLFKSILYGVPNERDKRNFEANILRELDNEHIISVLGTIEEKDLLGLVFPYMETDLY